MSNEQELCGCGRPVRYQTVAGANACNKYIRCDNIEPSPGPWKVSTQADLDKSNDHVMTDTHPSMRVCNVYGGLDWPRGLANARLISAAPEMLVALQKLMAFHNSDHEDSSKAVAIQRLFDEAIDIAQTAIAKATNKEPFNPKDQP